MIYRKIPWGWVKQRVFRSTSSQDRLYSLEGYYWSGAACSRTLRFDWILVGSIFGLGSSFMDLSGNLLLVSLVTRPGVRVKCRLKKGTGAQVWLDIGWICFGLGNSLMDFSGMSPVV